MSNEAGTIRVSIGRAMARLVPVLQPLRRMPVLGGLLHRASQSLVSPGTLVPVRVSKGIASGLWIRIDPRVAGPMQRGELEPALAPVLTALATPGAVFYDLGANVGYYALAIARLVGSEGRVVAFEADPDNADEIDRNAEANGIANLRVIRAAVWSEQGEVSFEVCDPKRVPGRGLGSVSSVPQFDGGRIVKVPAVTIDDVAREERPPDFLKCDVEGAEVEAFRGAARVLDEYRPTVICEMHTKANADTLEGLFGSRGYSWAWLDDMHVLARAR